MIQKQLEMFARVNLVASETDKNGGFEGYAYVWEDILHDYWVIAKGAIKSASVPLLNSHATESALGVIGRISVKPDDKGLLAKGVFANTQTAQEIRGLMNDGFLDSLSVGISVIDGTQEVIKGKHFFRITKAELREVSVVYAGASRNAKITVSNSATSEIVNKQIETEGGIDMTPDEIMAKINELASTVSSLSEANATLKAGYEAQIADLKAQLEKDRKDAEARLEANRLAMLEARQAPEVYAQRNITKERAPAWVQLVQARGNIGALDADVRAELRRDVEASSDTSYLIDTQTANDIVMEAQNRAEVLSAVRVEMTDSGQFSFPTATNTMNITYAGDTPVDSTLVSGKIDLVAQRAQFNYDLPIDALADSIGNLESRLREDIALQLALHMDDMIINGNGINRPLGMLYNPSYAAIDIVATNDGLAVSDIRALPERLKKAYRQFGASWVMSSAIKGRIAGFNSSAGLTAWQPSLQAGVPASLAGYPVLESEAMPASTAAAGDEYLIFGALKRAYGVIIRRGLSITIYDDYAKARDHRVMPILGSVRWNGAPTDDAAALRLTRRTT